MSPNPRPGSALTALGELRALAGALADQRAALAAATPLGEALEETRFDLGRIGAPVVAVVGPAKTGKSSLVNRVAGIDALPVGAVPTTALPVCLRAGPEGALVRSGDAALVVEGIDAIRARIRAPQPGDEYVVWQVGALAVPWSWLDTPGWDALERTGPLELDPWELADIWVLTTSATHPMAAGDRTLLLQLAALASAREVCVVVTRADQLDDDAHTEVVRWVEERVADLWRGDAPGVLAVSARTGDGIEPLTERLASAARSQGERRLLHELNAWGRLLDELTQVGQLKSLSGLEERTLASAREGLRRRLADAMADLRGRLPAIGEEIVRSLEEELPAAQRSIAPTYARRLESRLTAELDAVGRELEAALRSALGADLPGGGGLSLAVEQLTTLLDRGPPSNFEPRSAAMGASLGLSAGLSAALFAAIPVIGVPFAVASIAAGLAGGALGALFGGRGLVVDTEQLRERVASPLLHELDAELDRLAATARLEIERLCNVMERAAQVQHGGAAARAALGRSLDEARARHDELVARFERIVAAARPGG